MSQVPVKWCRKRDLHDSPLQFAGPDYDGVAVVELSALREVVEGLKRIAEPDQDPLRQSTDALRALSATLGILNAGREEAQRLLAQLEAHRKEGA